MLPCRADLTAANLLQSTPRFETFELANVPPPPSWPFAFPGSPFNPQGLNSSLQADLHTTFDDNLRGTFADLWKFPTSEKDPKLIDHMWYSDKIYLVQRSLMDVAYNKRKTSHIDRASALVALIYVHAGLCEVKLHSKIIGVLVSRLQSSLGLFMSESKPVSEGVRTVKKLLWALYFGGVAAAVGPERQWFVKHLAISCEALDLRTWADMMAILETVFWKEKWEKPVGALWRHLETARHEINGEADVEEPR